MNREQFIEQAIEFMDFHLERKDGVTDEDVRRTASKLADNVERDGIPFNVAMTMVLVAVLTM